MSLWRHDQRPLWQHCEDLLDQVPESTAYHFEGALRAATSQIAAAMEPARLVRGAVHDEVASLIARRMRVGDRAAGTTVIRRAIPTDGTLRRPVAVAAGILAVAAVVAIARFSVPAAITAALVLSIGTGAVWLLGGEAFVEIFRLFTYPEFQRARALRDEVTWLAAAGDPAAGSRYDELSAIAVGDPIANWMRAEAIKALAAMDDDVARRRAFAEARTMIEEDAVTPVTGVALARALVSLTPQFPGTEALLDRLLVIAPGVCGEGYFARRAMAERLQAERLRAER